MKSKVSGERSPETGLKVDGMTGVGMTTTHFFDRGEVLEQRARADGFDELFFDARPFDASGVSDLLHEFFHTVRS